MTKRIVAGSTMLLACFLAPVSPLAVGQGKGHAFGNSRAPRVDRIEIGPQFGNRTLVTHNPDTFPDRHGIGFGGAGHAFHSVFGRAAGLFRHPPGWDRGRKTGWRGGDVPPGLTRKENSRFAFLRHGPFARRGTGPFVRNGDITRQQVANFDRFLDLNPKLERSLSQNPSLIRDQAFLADHPALSAWLEAHPRAAEELREHPRAFMNFEHRFDMQDINRREVANFDRFLDANPSVATSLNQNPSLINNSAFLAQNPALVTWLKTHPQAADELRESPQAFMSLEQRFEAAQRDLPEVPSDL